MMWGQFGSPCLNLGGHLHGDIQAPPLAVHVPTPSFCSGHYRITCGISLHQVV